MKSISLLFALCVALTFTSTGFAQERITNEEEARAIFEEVEDRRTSISSEKAVMEMTITDSRGRTRNRSMQMWSQTEGNDTSSLIVFESPGNVQGTAFLTVREGDESQQRLYLPSVGRIQTITSGDRADSFMGSDFTYEDLGDQQSEDYEFEWLEEHDDHYLVKALKPESEQYSSVEFKIDREKYTLLEIGYFDENGEKIKRLEASDFEQIAEQLWSPGTMIMYDLREERNTRLRWSDRQINEQVEDWRFTERGLRRGI